MTHIRRRVARFVTWTTATITVAVMTASPAFADDPGTRQLKAILNNATSWLVGILAAVATLFLTVGGMRHLMAGGDPGEVEKAKGAYKSAAMGYALAVLAPIVVTILRGILGVK